jgi:hypothetical protein
MAKTPVSQLMTTPPYVQSTHAGWAPVVALQAAFERQILKPVFSLYRL